MRLEESSLNGYAMLGDLVRMRFLSGMLTLFLNAPVFIILNVLCLGLQARFFFQQLISGVSYCHAMVCELSFLFITQS